MHCDFLYSDSLEPKQTNGDLERQTSYLEGSNEHRDLVMMYAMHMISDGDLS